MMQATELNGKAYPVSYSLLSASTLLGDIMTDYDVGIPIRCQLWKAGVTDTYIVTTDRDRYALRVYPTGWRTDSDVAYELDALNYLQRKGVLVAAPVVRKDGGWFRVVQAPEGPRQIALFTYARGREAYEDQGFSLQFGRRVAEIHSATDDFHSPHSRFHIDLGELLDKPLAALQPVLAHRPDDWTYLLGLAGRLRKPLTNLPDSILNWGFCHGDSHGANAHLDGDRLTVFDFDCCGLGWRAYDLATFRWIWEWYDSEAAPRHWEQFLRGYREHRPLADPDLAVVPLFVALREFWLVGLHTRGAAVHGYFMLSDSVLDHRLEFLRGWEQHCFRNLW